MGSEMCIRDSHGTGVVGPQGRGAAYQALGSLSNILMVGSLSKAFSCLGGFVTCTPDLKTILKIRSSTFIFGGPVPPPYLAAICAVCDIFMSPEYEMILKSLRERIQRVRLGLDALGLAYHCGMRPLCQSWWAISKRLLMQAKSSLRGVFMFNRLPIQLSPSMEDSFESK